MMFQRNCKLKQFIFIFHILTNFITADSVNFQDIIKQIKEHEFHPHEIIISHYKDEQFPDIQDELFQATLKTCPTKIITFTRSQRNLIINKLPKPQRSFHQTTLFIVILKDNGDKDLLLNFLYDQTKTNFTPPRYLVIIVINGRESKNRISLYESSWKTYHIMHLTFIEVENPKIKRKQKKKYSKKIKLTQYNPSYNQRNMTIHHYNPFNKIYIRQKYEKGLSIFTNSLKNLHGLKIRAATVYHQSMRFRQDLNNNYIKNSTSQQTNLINFISKAMNFTLDKKLIPLCSLQNPTELGSIFKHAEVITNELPILFSYESHFSSYAFNSRRSKYRILLPIKRLTNDSQLELETPFFMGLISCLLVIIIWIILRLFKCEKKIIQPLNYIGLLLGNSVNINVVKLTDRIFFLSIVIGFWLFSSAFHSILTDIKIISKPKNLKNSLKDLDNLTVYFSSDFVVLNSEKVKYDSISSMFKKKMFISNDEECVHFLLNNAPAACLMQKNKAKNAILNTLDKNGHPRLKIFKGYKINLQTGTHFGEKSPLVFEFERYMRKLEQMGLINKWYKDSIRDDKLKYKQLNVTINKNVPMSLILLLILIIGFGLSIFAFIGEIFIKHNKKGMF